MLQRKKLDRTYAHLSPVLSKMDVNHGFFERYGGVSPEPYASLNLRYGVGDDRTHVDLNYQTVFKVLSIDPKSHIRLNVTNKDQIAIDPEAGALDGYDAVVFTQGSASVTAADCAPIMITHQNPDVYALIHAGWFGVTRRIVERTVQEMIDRYQVEPGACFAVIGPTIGPESYEIKGDTANEVKIHLPEYVNEILNYSDENKIYLDIPNAVELQLRRMGVEQIDKSESDVFADENFFSHRRDGEPTGRNGIFLSF